MELALEPAYSSLICLSVTHLQCHLRLGVWHLHTQLSLKLNVLARDLEEESALVGQVPDGECVIVLGLKYIYIITLQLIMFDLCLVNIGSDLMFELYSIC